MGQAGDTIGLKHGLGRHEQYLTAEQISTVTKWLAPKIRVLRDDLV